MAAGGVTACIQPSFAVTGIAAVRALRPTHSYQTLGKPARAPYERITITPVASDDLDVKSVPRGWIIRRFVAVRANSWRT